jgi:hypothetical protein
MNNYFGTHPPKYQCLGSLFIWYGSGSSTLVWIPIRIQGFDEQKLEKIYSWKNSFFLGSKTTFYISLGLYKRRSSYRRNLQPLKRTPSNLKHEIISLLFLFLWVIFALLDPDLDSGYGSTDLIKSWSNLDPKHYKISYVFRVKYSHARENCVGTYFYTKLGRGRLNIILRGNFTKMLNVVFIIFAN